MFIDLIHYKRYTKISTIVLWSALGMIVAASVLNGMLNSEFLVLFIRFLFAVFTLAGCARSALFALSPIPGQLPVVVRLVYGFMLAFILLIVGMWMMFNFITGLLA